MIGIGMLGIEVPFKALRNGAEFLFNGKLCQKMNARSYREIGKSDYILIDEDCIVTI